MKKQQQTSKLLKMKMYKQKYLDGNLSKIDGHLSFLEKDYNEIKILSDKQSIEEVLIQGAVETTIQILYDKGLFDSFPKADEVSKIFCLSQGVNVNRKKTI